MCHSMSFQGPKVGVSDGLAQTSLLNLDVNLIVLPISSVFTESILIRGQNVQPDPGSLDRETT